MLTIITILAGAVMVSAIIIFVLYMKIIRLREDISTQQVNRDKLMFQKKQSEIVTGQVAEKLAPFLKGFNHDPQNIQFLGNPIDFISFEKKGVVIIEVKSANSRLTSKQREIKKQIQNNQVFWEEFRIK